MATQDKNDAVFVISVAAQLGGVHPQTLRIYERRGLLEPFRTPGGTRRYSQADLERLSLIQELTEQGLNLKGVKKVLALQHRVAKLERQLAATLSRLSEERTAAHIAIDQARRSGRPEIVLLKDASRRIYDR